MKREEIAKDYLKIKRKYEEKKRKRALTISIVNCFRINLESINQIVRAAKAGRSIPEHSANYQFHAVARFLAKLTPHGWESGYNRSRYSDNQFKFKVGSETLRKCNRECYISASSTRSVRKYRGAIRKGVGDRTRART